MRAGSIGNNSSLSLVRANPEHFPRSIGSVRD
jgi:hypothetical protein